MAKNGFKVIDIEPHLEEPYDLWEKNLPKPYRSRLTIIAPKQGHLEVRTRHPQFTREGDHITIELAKDEDEGEAPSFVYVQGMRRWQTTPDLVKARVPYSRPEVYIEGFDVEGVDVGDLMPTTFGHIMSTDAFEPDFALAMCQVYNDWAAEFAQQNPERFKFWGVVPMQDARAAAKEAQRCLDDLGALGITAKDSGKYLPNDESLGPLWEVLDGYGAVVGFHGFCEGRNIRPGEPGHSRVDWIKRFGGPHASAVAGLIFGGVLDRYLNIKPLFMESGANGVPAMVEAMNDGWSLFGPDADFDLEMWPSEYYKDRCYTVTYAEGLLKYSIDYLGDDKLVFSTDYPHHDAPYPNGVSGFLEVEGVSDESKRKILWDNGAKLLKLQ